MLVRTPTAILTVSFLIACTPNRTIVVEIAPPIKVTVNRSAADKSVDDNCSRVVLVAPSTDAVCEDNNKFWYGSCPIKIHLTVHNCLASPIEIHKLDLKLEKETRIHWNFEDQLIAYGDTWNFEYSINTTGEYEFVLSYLTDKAELFVERTTLGAALLERRIAHINARPPIGDRTHIANGDAV